MKVKQFHLSLSYLTNTRQTTRCCGLITVIVVLPHDYLVFFFQFYAVVVVLVVAIVVVFLLFFTFLIFHVFFSAKSSIIVDVCIVKNEGGNFRKTMCNELSRCDHESGQTNFKLWHFSWYITSVCRSLRHFNLHAFN